MYEISQEQFERLPLRVHSFLAGVPLRTLYWLELPGGREGMTLREIQEITGFGGEGDAEVGPVTKALFDLRGWIGRILGWDEVPALVESVTYRSRLSEEDRGRSRVEPGTLLGISRVLYRFENELLAEIVNRTVHCFWVMASEKNANGYALYLAVYVRKLNWFTPVYMALVTPMLKWIVYPSMMKSVRRRWEQAVPVAGRQRIAEAASITGLYSSFQMHATQFAIAMKKKNGTNGNHGTNGAIQSLAPCIPCIPFVPFFLF